MEDKLYAYIGKLYVQNQELAKFTQKLQHEVEVKSQEKQDSKEE